MVSHRSARALLGALAAGGILCVSPAATAATRCSVESVSDVMFGTYRSNSEAPLDTTGFIAYSCDGVEASDVVSITLSRGRQGTFIPRFMTGSASGSGSKLEYNLFLNAARTVVWGDGSAGTGMYRARPPDGRTVSVPVYGRIAAGQSARPGPYEDLVVVTLLF